MGNIFTTRSAEYSKCPVKDHSLQSSDIVEDSKSHLIPFTEKKEVKRPLTEKLPEYSDLADKLYHKNNYPFEYYNMSVDFYRVDGSCITKYGFFTEGSFIEKIEEYEQMENVTFMVRYHPDETQLQVYYLESTEKNAEDLHTTFGDHLIHNGHIYSVPTEELWVFKREVLR